MDSLRTAWDLDLRAELYKEEFFRAPTWTDARDPMVVHWADSKTRAELDRLLDMKKVERPAHLGSIIREQDGSVMVGYWFDLLSFGPATRPLTTELVVATFQLAASAVMYFKDKFNRVRPWVLEPDLSPPIPLPGHPAYPSGHSTQMHLMGLMLAYLAPAAEPKIMSRALDVAVNRERAGLHYPSDTEAGRTLAEHVFAILRTECPMFKSNLEQAKAAEWPTEGRATHASRSSATAPGDIDSSWVKQQTERTRRYLDHRSLRTEVKKRADLLPPPQLPTRFQFPGGEMFLKEQSLYLKRDDEPAERLIAHAVADFRLSPDLKKVAYGHPAPGGDISIWSVRDLATNRDSGGDPIRVRLGTMYWDQRSTGIFYSSPPLAKEERAGARGKRIRYRSILPDAAKHEHADRVIFENPEWPNYADYGLWEVEAGTKYLAYRVQGLADIPLASYLVEHAGDTVSRKPVHVSDERALGKFVTVLGNEALFRTNVGEQHTINNKFGVIAVTLTDPFPSRVLVPEHQHDVLIQAQQIGRFLALQYITPQLTNVVRFFDLTDRSVSQWRPFDSGLPDYGTLSLFTGDSRSSKAYFIYSSIATPPRTLAVDLEDRPKVELLPSAAAPVDNSKVRYELSSYPSLDGQQIPIQIMTRSDSTSPPRFAYLYSYGAIGIPSLPEWNKKFQLILELGGMVAIANVRGGGELGFNWQFPVKLDRLKTLEDIAAASRWLKRSYPIEGNRICVSGRSYGGMHTFASMVQFPGDYDLFVPVMPVGDVVEFLENGLFGRSAWDDFGLTHNGAGDLRKTPDEVKTLKSWSPRENLAKLGSTIRPILVLTADEDERVEPDQAYSMTHALQARFGNDAPVYLWVESNSGHTASTEVEELTFIAKQFGIEALTPLF